MWDIWRRFFLWWQRRFGALGRVVGRHPAVCLALCLLAVGLCCLGFLNASFVSQIDELWVPSNSATVVNENSFNQQFTSDPYSRVERIFVVPRNPSADMLNPQTLSQVFSLVSEVYNVSVPAGNGTGRVTYSDMCAELPSNGGCVRFDPLGYWKNNETYMLSRTTEQLHDDANQLLLSGNLPVQQRVVLGCLDKRPSGLFDGDTVVISVGALLFTYFVDSSKVNQTTLEAWETALLDTLDSMAYPDITAYASTGVSISQEISRQSGGDVALLATVFLVMSVYVVMALTTFSPFRTRVLLGIGAVGSVLLGVLASLGFTALFWQFNPLTMQVLPFLMLSIGMDSLFILFSHYHISLRSLPEARPVLRSDYALAMEDSLFRQGASVALTALTKAVAFLGPCIVLRIPALFQFCIVVAISICFEVFLAFFCFCPLLIFDAWREHSHRADILPCIKVPVVDPAPEDSEEGGEDGEDAQYPQITPQESVIAAVVATAGAANAAAAAAAEQHSQGAASLPSAAGEGSKKNFAPPAGEKALAADGEDSAHCERSNRSFVSCFGSTNGSVGMLPIKKVDSESSSSSRSSDEAEIDGEAAAERGALQATAPAEGVAGALAEATPPMGGKGGLLDLSRETERQRRTPLGKFLLDVYVPKVLCSVWGQIAVYVLFGGLLAAGIYGVITVGESLDLRSLITEGTQLYNYLDYEDKCDTHIGPPMYLITGNVDYSNPQISAQVKDLVASVESSQYVEKPIYSWYSDFTDKFLPYSNWTTLLDASGWPVSSAVFYLALDDFLNSFAGTMYKSNINVVRAPPAAGQGKGQIVAITSARMQGFYEPLNNTKDFVHAMLDTRAKVANITGVPAYTQSYFYPFYEQFLSIIPQYLAMLSLTVIAIFIVTLVFMGFKTAFVVSALVLMIHIDMLGITSFVGVMMNAIAAVNAVAIMGLADEYVNYVMRAFELEEGKPEERIKSALLQYFRPVSNAAICTIIGILPLAFAKSALYKVYYFRMFFVATVISWLTGIVFLPVLLLSTHGVGLGAPVRKLLERRKARKQSALSETPEEA